VPVGPEPFCVQARSLERVQFDSTFVKVDLQSVVAPTGAPYLVAEHLTEQSCNVTTDC
jgi:hypothetical protein